MSSRRNFLKAGMVIGGLALASGGSSLLLGRCAEESALEKVCASSGISVREIKPKRTPHLKGIYGNERIGLISALDLNLEGKSVPAMLTGYNIGSSTLYLVLEDNEKVLDSVSTMSDGHTIWPKLGGIGRIGQAFDHRGELYLLTDSGKTPFVRVKYNNGKFEFYNLKLPKKRGIQFDWVGSAMEIPDGAQDGLYRWKRRSFITGEDGIERAVYEKNPPNMVVDPIYDEFIKEMQKNGFRIPIPTQKMDVSNSEGMTMQFSYNPHSLFMRHPVVRATSKKRKYSEGRYAILEVPSPEGSSPDGINNPTLWYTDLSKFEGEKIKFERGRAYKK